MLITFLNKKKTLILRRFLCVFYNYSEKNRKNQATLSVLSMLITFIFSVDTAVEKMFIKIRFCG